jgi:hypothetical protein
MIDEKNLQMCRSFSEITHRSKNIAQSFHLPSIALNRTAKCRVLELFIQQNALDSPYNS